MMLLAWVLLGWAVLVAPWAIYSLWRERRAVVHQEAVLRAIEEQRRVPSRGWVIPLTTYGVMSDQSHTDALLIDLVLSESGTTDTYQDDMESYI